MIKQHTVVDSPYGPLTLVATDGVLSGLYMPQQRHRPDEETFGEEDLYPDVRPTLGALRDAGLWVGVAGNQTVRAGGILRSLGLPADFIATSDDWGVSKPDPAFFTHVVEAAPCAAGEVLYVGDRLDNDIRPAVKSGLLTALVARGPWGTIQRDDPDAVSVATMRLDGLAELPERVAAFNAGAR